MGAQWLSGRVHARIQEFSSGGVQVSLTKKSSDNVFFFFLVLSLFYRSQMVIFKEIYHFSRFQRGSNIFQGGGGSNFSQGGGGRGSNCLFPIETHITCDFSGGGGVRTPCPPSGSALGVLVSRQRGCEFEPHLRHCVVFLSKTH